MQAFLQTVIITKQPTGIPKKRGVKQSEFTRTVGGRKVPNNKVVSKVKLLLEEEFVDYGYLKVTYNL